MIIFHVKDFKNLNIKRCKRFFSQYGGIKVKIQQQFDYIQKNAIIKITDEKQPFNNIVINIYTFDSESKKEFFNEFSKTNNIRKSALEKFKHQGEIEYYDNFKWLMAYVFILYMIKIKNIKVYSVRTTYDKNSNELTKYVKIEKRDIIEEINYISEKVKQNLCVRPKKCIEVAAKLALKFIPIRSIYHYRSYPNRGNRSVQEVLRQTFSAIGFLGLNRTEKVIATCISVLLWILVIGLFLFIVAWRNL